MCDVPWNPSGAAAIALYSVHINSGMLSNTKCLLYAKQLTRPEDNSLQESLPLQNLQAKIEAIIIKCESTMVVKVRSTSGNIEENLT